MPGLEGVDTRALTRQLRERGTLRGILAPLGCLGLDELVELARQSPSVSEQSLVAEVSCTAAYQATDPLHAALRRGAGVGSGARREGDRRPRIAVVDLGVKLNTLRSLVSRGAEVWVLPHSCSLEELERLAPDGVVLTNGPGDPAELPEEVLLTKAVLQRYPVLAICLGHQLVARAIGATTSRLPFGHHGGNHPVLDLTTQRTFVTAQNHEFRVDEDSIPEGSGWFVSERSLNDGSVEGLRHSELPVISVQYHPEGSPGPQDRQLLFDEFLELCQGGRARPQLVAEGGARPGPELKKVLVLGSGPIVIGQAAEFDYAGTQACRSLREEGVEVVLVNSNPATIMTDEGTADRVYLEPLTTEAVERVIAIERRVFPTPWSLAMFVLELSKQSGICLAAMLDSERGRRLVGYLICSRYEQVWHVMNVAVDVERQRAGIASALLAELYAQVDDEHPVDAPLAPPTAMNGNLLLGVGDHLDRECHRTQREHRLDAGDQLHEERLHGEGRRRSREHEPASVRTRGRERARRAVWIPAQLVRDPEDAGSSVFRQARAPVQRVRDRPLRHTRALRDVPDRDPLSRTRLCRHVAPSPVGVPPGPGACLGHTSAGGHVKPQGRARALTPSPWR